CCNGATCMVTAPSQCTGDHKRFVGSGAACNALGDDTTPCCKADFSQNGIETVQDVFDFLSSWFAGDAGADADGNGTLSVNDIFAFVMQWFNGCP
ncbi:MAG TPA: GC-type dockerin domain-anchored protein, partial [Phycisphaerales bacterium]|nr:GC-type dockerin domain-anchored protein [Phycisphaerales bacterium]